MSSNQKLHFLSTSGSQRPPLDMRTVAYWFDNCALSCLTDPAELKASPSAQEFRKLLRAHYPEALVLHLGPAVVERFLLQTQIPLAEILKKKSGLSAALRGGGRGSAETIEQFHESFAFVLMRLMGLFLMIVKANEIHETTRGLKGEALGKLRIERFAEWATQNPEFGAQNSVAAAIYTALAGNEQAKTSLAVAKKREWPKLLNGAWDLKHLDVALTMVPPKALPPGSLLAPAAVFVTADKDLSGVLSSIRLAPGRAGMLIQPQNFPKDPSLVDFVQQHITHIQTRLPSPNDYAEGLLDVANSLELAEASSGGHAITTALSFRCREVARALSGRTSFSLDQADEYH